MMKNRKLRICYFLPINSPHSINFLNSIHDRGHQLYYFSHEDLSFRLWKPKTNVNKTFEKQSYVKNKSKINSDLIINYFKSFYKPILSITPLVIKDILVRIYYFRISKSVKKQILKIGPDIVHAHYISRNGIYAYLSKFKPYILTIWGSDIRLDLMTKYQNRLFIKSLKNADAVTSGSNELLTISQDKGAIKENSHFIGMPGINISQFENVKVPKQFYEDMEIPTDAKVIFSPRAMNSLYRIDIIVEAFFNLERKIKNTFLILLNYATDPDYLHYINCLVNKRTNKNKVKLLLDLPLPYPNINLLYAISSVTVSIPKTDGMPQTTYESFAAGCPVVGSDLSTYDGILDHEHSGLRVSGNSAKEVSDAIFRVISEKTLREKIINNSKKIVLKYGNIYTETNKMENLYFSLIKENMEL